MKNILTAVLSTMILTNVAHAGLQKYIMTSTEEVFAYIKSGVPKTEKVLSFKEGSLIPETVERRKMVSVISSYRYQDHTMFLMNVDSQLKSSGISLRIDLVQTISPSKKQSLMSNQNRMRQSRLDMDQTMDLTRLEVHQMGQKAMENLSALDLDLAAVAKTDSKKITLLPESADSIRYADNVTGGSAGAIYSIRLELPQNVTKEELEKILFVVASAM